MNTDTKTLAAELRRTAGFTGPADILEQAADRLEELEPQLAAERALADRLAESIEWYRLNVGDCNKGGDDGALSRDALSKDIGRNATKALAAWKEARHE